MPSRAAVGVEHRDELEDETVAERGGARVAVAEQEGEEAVEHVGRGDFARVDSR